MTMVVGDIPEPGLGMAASFGGGLEAVSFSDSAVVTSTGADLVGIVVVLVVMVVAAGAGVGAAVGAVAFVTGGSPAPGVGAGAGAGVSPAVDLVALHFLSLHRELRRRRLSLWARALVASITGWQTGPGTRMHLVWDRGADRALEELGSSFVEDATEAEVKVVVRVEVRGWVLVLATMGSPLSGSDGVIGNLAQRVWP